MWILIKYTKLDRIVYRIENVTKVSDIIFNAMTMVLAFCTYKYLVLQNPGNFSYLHSHQQLSEKTKYEQMMHIYTRWC